MKRGIKIKIFSLLGLLFLAALINIIYPHVTSRNINLGEINISKWDETLIDELHERLNINDYDYEKKLACIISFGKKYCTIEEHIRDWLENRDVFFEILDSSMFSDIISNEITIIEFYKPNYARYIVDVSNDKLLSVKIYNKGKRKVIVEYLNSAETNPYSEQLKSKDVSFDIGLESAIKSIQIKTVVTKESKNIKYRIKEALIY